MNRDVRKDRLHTVAWAALAVMALVSDSAVGPVIQFPITFLLPIALAAWYDGRWWGWLLAVIMPVVRMCLLLFFWDEPWSTVETIANALIRVTVFSLFVFFVDRVSREQRKLSEGVRVLQGLLPICSYCKKIRMKDDVWQPIEQYIASHSQADFSHSLCPECMKKEYGEFFGEDAGSGLS